MTEAVLDTAIAVTGMAGRFPGAPNLRSFWRNLCAGVDAIQHFTLSDMRRSGVASDLLEHPSFVPACAPIPDPYAFDDRHFGLTPAAARALDPQHRVFLECAWAALEAAGVFAAKHSAIAVFAGCSDSTYRAHPAEWSGGQGNSLAADIGTSSDYLATRVAFLLNLRGPAATVRTACSTSLVAIHLAVQSLLTHECDAAVAGGAAIRHPLRRGHIFEPGGIYSADGRCRPYDHLGSGIVSGDGAGAVVLRRLGDAINDGDHIHAVIRGSAINNDGAAKASFAAPSVNGQLEVALTALEMADVEPSTIGFIEGHGTATPLGDPIEVEALSRVWEQDQLRGAPCVLGSVKSGIGHLDAAAGVASFIKACLAVEHGRIPGTLNYTAPNPHSTLADSPFVVSAVTRDWQEAGPRRASVHSLGLGGTNAHIVLEQAPERHHAGPLEPSSIPVALTLSTRRPEVIGQYAESLAEELTTSVPDVAVAARTLDDGRTQESYRRVAVGSSREQLIHSLRSLEPSTRPTTDRPRLVLVFPGDGKRVHGALRELGQHLPQVATVLRDAAEHLKSRWGVDLFAAMSGADSSAVGVLPTIVAQGIALYTALDTFGAGGDVVLGLSLGELTAAAASGLITVEDALDLSMAREIAFRAVAPSGALAVGLEPGALAKRLPPRIELSVVNSPYRCVVSGPVDALERFAKELQTEGIPVHTLDVISAVHSCMLDPVLDEFRHAASLLQPRHPTRTLVSSVGQAQVDEQTAADPDHWVRQLREPIRFDTCLRSAISRRGDTVIMDVGPSGGLTAAIRETVGSDARAVVTASRQTDDISEIEAFALSLARLWEEGIPIDWDAWPRRASHRTALPVPPLARTVHAPDTLTQPSSSQRARTEPPPVALWGRSWRRVHPPVRQEWRPRQIAVLIGADPLGRTLAGKLAQRGYDVEMISSAADAGTIGGRDVVIDARALGASDGPAAAAALLEFAVAAARAGHAAARHVVLTRGAFDIVGSESLSTAAAAVAASALVVSQEYDDLPLTCLDLDNRPIDADVMERVLMTETTNDIFLALRDRSVWKPVVDKIDGPPAANLLSATATACVVTGGLGRFGRWIGRWLAEHGCRNLFLIGRTGIGPDAMSETAPAGSEQSRRAEAVAAMQAAGARVTVVQADVTDRSSVFRALDQAHRIGAGAMTILHLAGEPNAISAGLPLDDLVKNDLRSALDEQWTAKVSGADILLHWTRLHPDARCITFSSNAALLGGPGLAAYAAANAALDILAIQAGDREGLNWCSVGWDGWRLPDDPLDLAPSALEEFALRGEEPWEALQDAIAAARCHVAVAKGDFAARHGAWVEYLTELDLPSRTQSSTTVDAGSTGIFGISAGYRDVIVAVRQIWADVFGRVVHDDADLFKEGGDSLVAMRIRSRLERELNTEVTLQEVLGNRTIADLSALVRKQASLSNSSRVSAEQEPEPVTSNETIRGRI